MGDDTKRFTLELPTEVVEALDDYCEVQTMRATSVIGSKVKVGRSKAIEAILRKNLKVRTD
jgi:metal-responsive CopG/Arc/MetJ family transcriptional regulator